MTDSSESQEFLCIFLAMTRLKYIEVIRENDLAQKLSSGMRGMTHKDIAKAGRDWLFSEGMDSIALEGIPEEERGLAIELFGETLLEELDRLSLTNN